MDKTTLPKKPEILPRPFEIVVTQEFLDILKRSGGWAFPITYKIGERLTIYVKEG